MAAYLPMQGLAARTSFMAGCAVSFVGSLAGGLPLALTRVQPPGQATGLLLGSILLRLVVVLLGTVAVVLATSVDRRVFLLSVAASYLVFLVVDMVYTLRRPGGER